MYLYYLFDICIKRILIHYIQVIFELKIKHVVLNINLGITSAVYVFADAV